MRGLSRTFWKQNKTLNNVGSRGLWSFTFCNKKFCFKLCQVLPLAAHQLCSLPREGAEQSRAEGSPFPLQCFVYWKYCLHLHQGICPSSVLTAQENCQGWVMAERNPVGTTKMTAAILKRACLASHFSLKSALPWQTEKSVYFPERKRR